MLHTQALRLWRGNVVVDRKDSPASLLQVPGPLTHKIHVATMSYTFFCCLLLKLILDDVLFVSSLVPFTTHYQYPLIDSFGWNIDTAGRHTMVQCLGSPGMDVISAGRSTQVKGALQQRWIIPVEVKL